jgi:hypothetical protein
MGYAGGRRLASPLPELEPRIRNPKFRATRLYPATLNRWHHLPRVLESSVATSDRSTPLVVEWTQVWQRLAAMRHGAVYECYTQIRAQWDQQAMLRFRGQRHGDYSQGHELPWRQRRRIDRAGHPLIPGRLLAGDDGLVKGSYMARTGGGADLRVWVARCQGVPEQELPYRRAPVCDKALLKGARAVDRAIYAREERNFEKRMMEHFQTANKTEALAQARQEGLFKPSEAVHQGMGEVRAPLEGLWLNDYQFPVPLVGADPNDAVDAWRPPFDYTHGLKDPLHGRWRYNDELPPHAEPDHATYRPGGLPRTSLIHLQAMLRMARQGQPYLNCLGGVRLPDNNATILALLASTYSG